MRKLEINLKDGCQHCNPKLRELQQIFDDFEGGLVPRDVKLTLEFTSDWLGEATWHLNKVSVLEREEAKNND